MLRSYRLERGAVAGELRERVHGRLEDGRIGDISLAEANFSNERGLELTPQTWRYYADKSPGGAFIQLGVHHADTLQFLLGPVKSVTAHARKLYTKSEVPDAVMAILGR